jgi:ABC-type uncharacterized transport system ATPase subunit
MVIIEHDMQLLAATCHRLVALELGSVIADGMPDEVLSHPLVIASYLGTSAETDQRFDAGSFIQTPSGRNI